MLTDRERDVLGLMVEGRSNAAIAGVLVIAEATVEKHINSIFAKLAWRLQTATTGGSARCWRI